MNKKSMQVATKLEKFCNTFCLAAGMPILFRIDKYWHPKPQHDISRVEIIIPRRIFKDSIIGSFIVDSKGKREYGPTHGSFDRYYKKIKEALDLFDYLYINR